MYEVRESQERDSSAGLTQYLQGLRRGLGAIDRLTVLGELVIQSSTGTELPRVGSAFACTRIA